jgi:hypothetical protein
MRKRQITSTLQSTRPSDEAWLDLDHAALVEVTSEEDGYPIESALIGGDKRGWRAASKGTQTIRLIFDQPQRFKRIWLVFEESQNRRTQEFVLRSSQDHGQSFREIIRQQWNFSPPDSIREVEDYVVDLYEVTQLELIIVPDKSGSDAFASLANLRLG